MNTDPYNYKADRARGNLQRRVQAEIEKRQSEVGYNTVVTYNLTEPVLHLKFFIDSNGSNHIEPYYGNTILHLLVQDLACFQSNFGAFLSEEEALQKINTMQNKIDKICYFLEKYGYSNVKNKRKFTVIETFLYTLPIFSSKEKILWAVKAEEKLVKILAKLLVYASTESSDIKSNQKKLLRKGYPLAANCLIDEITIAGKERAERESIYDQLDNQGYEEPGHETPVSNMQQAIGGVVNIEDIIDNINPSVDEDNPLYPMIEAEIKAREKAEAREKHEREQKIAAEAKISDLELELKLLKEQLIAAGIDIDELPEQQSTSGSTLLSFEKSKGECPSLHDQVGIESSYGPIDKPKTIFEKTKKIVRK